MQLKTKLSLAQTGLVVGIILAVGGMTIYSEREVLKDELADRHQQLLSRFAEVCEESHYQSGIAVINYLKTFQSETGYRFGAFVDPKGTVVIHSNPHRIDQPYENDSKEPTTELKKAVVYAGKVVGTAHLVFSKKEIQEFLNSTLKKTLKRVLAISLIAVIIGIFAALLLAKLIVSPIQLVVKGMRAVGQGRLTPISFPQRNDELGWMGNELNVTINKLKELDEMKQDFVSGVTHELRSPLTAIDRFVMHLNKGLYGKMSADQMEALVTIQNNTSRLTRFIDNLLSVAKLEAQRMDIHPAELDIREVISEVQKLFTPLAKEKGLALTTEFPEKPLPVWADKDKVFQILINLVSNGIKFTPRGSVKITAKDNGEKIVVQVSDSGPGIPENQIPNIFDKFYRAKNTEKTTKGTGLGLSIVRGLVEAQKGQIKVTSQPNVGSQFSFSLPKPSSLG